MKIWNGDKCQGTIQTLGINADPIKVEDVIVFRQGQYNSLVKISSQGINASGFVRNDHSLGSGSGSGSGVELRSRSESFESEVGDEEILGIQDDHG